MADDELPQSLVMDYGAHTLRFGANGDDLPKTLHRNVVGRDAASGEQEFFATALAKRYQLELSYPMYDPARMIEVVAQGVRELKEDKTHLLVSLPVVSLRPKPINEALIKTAFEELSLGGFQTLSSPIGIAYSSGRTTCLAIDVGHFGISILPIWEGSGVFHASVWQKFGGNDVTKFMAECLKDNGLNFTTAAELEKVGELKESLAYAPKNFEQALYSSYHQPSPAEHVTLPDGTRIEIPDTVRFMAGEAIFTPAVATKGSADSFVGIADLIADSLAKCPIDIVKDVRSNLVLAGGASKMAGFKDRLAADLALRLGTTDFKIVTPDTPEHCPWIGGSILSSLFSAKSAWITREEYDEVGVNSIWRLM